VTDTHRPDVHSPDIHRPTIGVFDSGVGGLTVLSSLLRHIPDANYLYFGDTARLPYGSKSAATVAHYAVGAIRHLQSHGAERLVIACNTATALAFDEIKAASDVEVIGVVEPGARAAAEASRNRKVVVIGTEATVASHAYRRALEAHGIAVQEKACPLFVPLVEEGWSEHPVTEQVAQIYLDEAFSGDLRDADVLVLGCTHYPLLKPLLSRIAPAHVAIVDSAESTAHDVARQLARQIERQSTIDPLPSSRATTSGAERHTTPRVKFFATDSAEKFKKMGSRFLGHPVEDVVHVDLKE
jgi:glutamate racemase